MKPPPLTRAQILKGLRVAHARFSKMEAEARTASENVLKHQPNSPAWETAAAEAFAARERVVNELWRLAGAIEFHIGVRR